MAFDLQVLRSHFPTAFFRGVQAQPPENPGGLLHLKINPSPREPPCFEKWKVELDHRRGYNCRSAVVLELHFYSTSPPLFRYLPS